MAFSLPNPAGVTAPGIPRPETAAPTTFRQTLGLLTYPPIRPRFAELPTGFPTPRSAGRCCRSMMLRKLRIHPVRERPPTPRLLHFGLDAGHLPLQVHAVPRQRGDFLPPPTRLERPNDKRPIVQRPVEQDPLELGPVLKEVLPGGVPDRDRGNNGTGGG